MKKLLFILGVLLVLEAHGQDYFIFFTGSGASTAVDYVLVENLSSGTSLKVSGNDILHLTTGLSTGVKTFEENSLSKIKIYPNPMTVSSKVIIHPPVEGDAIITVTDINGRKVAQFQCFLESTLQEFQLSGFAKGFYLISAKGKSYQYSEKLLCNGTVSGVARIERINSKVATIEKKSKVTSKGLQATKDMLYNDGERLKFTGMSGNYSTIKTDIPTESKTVSFNFILCIDGESNYYPVTTIGTQVWMAENLKTTQYKDGNPVPLVSTDDQWKLLTTPAYCWYNNNETINKALYGALYNWYAVNTGKLCPTGWHVPTLSEWSTLIAYSGGAAEAGNKLKEAGDTYWGSDPWGYNQSTNESGFSARPGGCRTTSIPIDTNYVRFEDAFYWAYWWTSSAYSTTVANYIVSGYKWGDFSPSSGRLNSNKKSGQSVRCIKD